ncbi:LOB domain-containing protein 18-like [Triticum dicoccoides]|uniref:LOB domain-containing protein 18-like n=1 Tax=Triticum dicoccoides TaxID=85692 RepID=UPI000E797D53|nr:LOB domain-containing protein 18-like [Triticum dicoccoides]
MSGSSTSASVSVGGRPSGCSGGPCGACKFLRRKCADDCIFAPYFDSEQGVEHFTAVHKVFGASNVSKILNQAPPHKRLDAAITVCYEAKARLRDPIYGCVGDIFALQQRVANLQAEVAFLQAHLTTPQQPSPPPFLSPPYIPMTTEFSISELASLSNVPNTIELSSLFDPSMQWAFQQQHQQPYGQTGEGSGGTGNTNSNGDDLQALARELLDRRSTGLTPQQPSNTQF